MIKFPGILMNRGRNLFLWVWSQEGTPGQCSRGLAIGVFFGCFPLFGFQTLLGLAFATIFKGNYLLAAAGTWISNPITYLPLFWFNYQVGCIFLGPVKSLESWGSVDWETVWFQGSEFSSRLIIGSSVVGLSFSIMLGTLTYVLLINKEKRQAIIGRDKYHK